MAPSPSALRRWLRTWPARRRSVGASVLLVPVPEVEFVYERWSGERDRVGVPGLSLHVTVLYPFLEPSRIDHRVERELEQLASSQSAFEYTLSGLGRFPGVLYISVSPADRFVGLTRAIHAKWPSHPPYGGAYEETVPHVTLALGDEPAELVAAVEPALPVKAVARELLLLTRNADGDWVPRSRFALGGEDPGVPPEHYGEAYRSVD
jgi:2'-5' RNA ligase